MYSYGCKKDTPDDRDKKYPTKIGMASLPVRVNLIPKLSPCYDQLMLNSCVANAVAAACNYLDPVKSPDPSRLFIYYNGRDLEGQGMSDDGMQIRSGIKAVAKNGFCREILWSYQPPKVNTKPNAICYEEGLKHQAIEYLSVDQEEQKIKQVLADGYPVVFGFVVYNSFESNSVRLSGKLPMPRMWDRMVGRHAVVLVGYDDTTKEYIVRNSWGRSWGMKGNFTMPYKFLHNPKYCSDFWVIKSIEKES